MLHGLLQRLHAGTTMFISGSSAGELQNEPCAVERFDRETSRWIVVLRRPAHGGKKLGVPEDALSFGFAILPQNVTASSARARMVASQGGCGRGLVATAATKRGTELYTEEPMFVSPTGVAQMWSVRWRAYLTMQMGAQSNPMMGVAAHAFDELTEGDDSDEGKAKVRAAAERIFDEAIAANPAAGADPAVREEQVGRVFSVLMRWQSNQFRFPNGTGPDGAAAAIYRYTASMNHACAPTVVLEPQWSAQQPGEAVVGDGRIIARALADLQPGDPLTINYGPRDLVGWPLDKRREYLRAKHGFVCGCPRCEAESQYAEQQQQQQAA